MEQYDLQSSVFDDGAMAWESDSEDGDTEDESDDGDDGDDGEGKCTRECCLDLFRCLIS